MAQYVLQRGLCLLGLLAVVIGQAQPPATEEVNKKNLEAALRITRAAAAEYEIRVGEKESPLALNTEPVFRWSNPVVGDIHGNVFVWTRDARPLAVGSFYHEFSSRPAMSHEFHSLAEEPLEAKFHGEPVWSTDQAGLKFDDVPKVPAPGTSESQRSLQLKQLAKQFTGVGVFGKDTGDLELRLLPQPIYRYAAPKQGVLAGGLFAFVRATDPEILLLLEARSFDDKVNWQFAAVRMHSTAELWLKHGDRRVWTAEPLEMKEVFQEHQRPYTCFKFKDVPEFLKEALIER